jgi:hypothetical protein
VGGAVEMTHLKMFSVENVSNVLNVKNAKSIFFRKIITKYLKNMYYI